MITTDDIPQTTIFSDLIARCEKANIEYDLLQTGGFDSSDDKDNQHYMLKISIPCGRKKRDLHLAESDIDAISEIEFESWRFIEGYYAIWSDKFHIIEAEIDARNMPYNFIQRPISFNLSNNNFKPLIESRIERMPRQITVQLGIDSFYHKCLIQNRYDKIFEFDEIPGASIMGKSRPIMLRVEGAECSCNDSARKLLEKVSNTFFFQLDLLCNFSFYLAREKVSDNKPEIVRGKLSIDNVRTIPFPKTEYNSTAISLYWYASMYKSMPLLQFLAFYQVIEFFFPTYTNIEAIKKVRCLLKDPSFNMFRDKDIEKIIINSLPTTRAGSDEREQLKITLKSCIDSEELKKFLREDEEMLKHITKKDKELPVSNIPNIDYCNSEDLIACISNRIYDIRCAIVHTKSSQSKEQEAILLPFSRSAEILHYDIKILKFVAKQVLISSGEQFEFTK